MIEKKFESIKMAPRDPILGLTELFKSDSRPEKINLGVGVYYDDLGQVPLLKCVQQAEVTLAERAIPRAYLPINGDQTYCDKVQELLFGASAPAIEQKKVITVQTLGGTGALRLGGDFLKSVFPDSTVWISDPSWENHRGVFERTGFTVDKYPYYDSSNKGVKYDEMIMAFERMPIGSIVVLHACCHNPTGVDLNINKWDEVIDVMKNQKLVPFLDIAYQGFGDGLDEDGQVIKKFADSGMHFLTANSFSKSFSLYGERVGGLSIMTANENQKNIVGSHLKKIARATYSNPPTHGSKLVSTVLSSQELFSAWKTELADMRNRIKLMRELICVEIKKIKPEANFNHVIQQRGMFSYTGLSKEQVIKLREKHSVYAIETGRICVAALNSKNLARAASAIAEVL